LSEYRNRLYLASLLDIRGQTARAAAEREQAERIAQEIRPSNDWLVVLGRQYARDGALDRAARVLEVIEARTGPGSSDFQRAIRLEMQGELAAAQGNDEAAETALETAR
jgi:hypothetical protein